MAVTSEEFQLGFVATLPRLLATAVDRYGDDEFVVTPTQRLSFREADHQSRLLAKRLVAAGLGKGARVGMLLPTGLPFVIAWFAAARIGAIPMQFSTTYRAAELGDALRFGDVQLLITSRELVGRNGVALVESAVPELVGQTRDQILVSEVPFLRSVWFTDGCDRPWATSVDEAFGERAARIDDRLMDELESEVSPDDPMAVIFTSGSAARPKAVIHSQGNAIRKTGPGVELWPPMVAPGRYFCGMPFFWIGGTQMLLSALHHGGAIVCQERFDAIEASELIRRERCTGTSGWLVDRIPGAGEIPNVNVAIARKIKQVSDKGDPRNLGMTETFGPHRDPRFVEYRIIDRETGAALPLGEEGEFLVRGPGLMVGMYKKERTDVFDVEGFYHTGDRGYIEDGTIFFTGRYSEMIKSAGANVAPPEVERALMSLPEIDEAIVFGVPDGERGELIAAVIVPAADAGDLTADWVRTRMRDVISPFKIPHLVDVVDGAALPRLMSSKPDKRRIRAAFVESRSVRGEPS